LGKVTREDVENAFRYILGREANDDAAVDAFVQHCTTFDALRRNFINSKEFRDAASLPPPDAVRDVPLSAPLNSPYVRTEVDASAPQLRAMIEQVERTWTHLGAESPHWSVLSHENYTPDAIDKNIEQFYASGALDLSAFTATVKRTGRSLEGLKSCFELGCGVGRVTIWLAELFAKVYAGDISSNHLNLAREALQQRRIGNIELVHVNHLQILSELPPFDAFFSVIVLQHNPPPIIALIVRNILERLNPGGLAYFQVPTYVSRPFIIEDYLKTEKLPGQMEMHALPQHALLGIAEESNCRLVEIREDRRIADGWVSNAVLLEKRK